MPTVAWPPGRAAARRRGPYPSPQPGGLPSCPTAASLGRTPARAAPVPSPPPAGAGEGAAETGRATAGTLQAREPCRAPHAADAEGAGSAGVRPQKHHSLSVSKRRTETGLGEFKNPTFLQTAALVRNVKT